VYEQLVLLRKIKQCIAGGEVETILRGTQRYPLQLALGHEDAVLIDDELIEC